MSSIQTFSFDSAAIRVVVKDGEPWFVAVDVCSSLDLGNPRSSIALLDLDEKGVHSMDTLGGEQATTIISESGMYSLILRSRKPEAKAFKRWITAEVLPSIRKTGAYQLDTPKSFAQALRLAAEQQDRIEAQALLIEQQRPAVEFVDRFVEAKSAKGFREVAKILGIKEREFIAKLADDGVIFKQGNNWLPTAHHQHSGRFEVKTGEANGHAFIQTRFTPEGIAWVARRFVKEPA